jgi:hypothetical protein
MKFTTFYRPDNDAFRSMEKKDIKEFYEGFVASLPSCLEQLVLAIRTTPGFEKWNADYSPDSLDILGNWFMTQVKTREITAEELASIQSKLVSPMEIGTWTLSNETLTLAVLVGMYYGQVAVTNLPGVKWELSFHMFGKRKMADYGQPILNGVGVVPINPVRVANSLAYGFADRSATGKRLREAYEYWATSVISAPAAKN